MAVNVVLSLPVGLEEQLRRETPALEAEVKEAYILSLFRRGRLTHYEVAEALGIDRHETDALLQRHGIFEGGLTMADLASDQETLAAVMRKAN